MYNASKFGKLHGAFYVNLYRVWLISQYYINILLILSVGRGTHTIETRPRQWMCLSAEMVVGTRQCFNWDGLEAEENTHTETDGTGTERFKLNLKRIIIK